MSDCIRPGREHLEQLYQESLALIEALRQQVAGQQALIQGLQEQIAAQQKLVQQLQDQLTKDSHNSGKPPSSDGLKKGRRKSLRRSGQRPRGGQRGHKGRTLMQVTEPEHVVVHGLAGCPHCQTDLTDVAVQAHMKRQVFDIPPASIEVTEHQVEVKLIRKRDPLLSFGSVALLAISILIPGGLSYRNYFQNYGLSARRQKDYHGQWSDAALELTALSPTDEQVFLVLTNNRFSHYGFDYLYAGGAPVYIVETFDHRGVEGPYELYGWAPDQVLFMLAAKEELPAATIVMLDWEEEFDWNDEEEEELFNLLGQYGRHAGSRQFSSFRLHTFEDLFLPLLWRFYDEQIEPRAVRYDAEINLLGLAAGQGAQRMNSHELVLQHRDRPLWVGLRWQIEPSGLNSSAPNSKDVDYALVPPPLRCRRRSSVP